MRDLLLIGAGATLAYMFFRTRQDIRDYKLQTQEYVENCMEEVDDTIQEIVSNLERSLEEDTMLKEKLRNRKAMI